MTDVVLALTTLPVGEAGRAIARLLVEERLAACVNLLPPMRSVYRWQGALSEDQECQALVKTTRSRLEALRLRLAELHPYELPEFLVVSVTEGSAAFLQWVRDSAAPDSGE